MVNRGLLLIVSGPSGVGKGTVCARILAQSNDTVVSVSATTRPPRAGEVEGKNYFFLTKDEFFKKRDRGEFLEWAEVFGNYYGTPADKVAEKLKSGKNVILEIDTQGAMQVKAACPEGVSIFILPPSFEELKKRITKRGTESPQIIQKRLSCAKAEMDLADKYDHVVINVDASKTASDIIEIINMERSRRCSCSAKKEDTLVK